MNDQRDEVDEFDESVVPPLDEVDAERLRSLDERKATPIGKRPKE